MPKQLIKNALKSLPKNTADSHKQLLKILGEHVPSEDRDLFDADLFCEMASSHWNLSEQREKGAPSIRIYCPITHTDTLRKTVIDVVSDDMAFLVDSVVAEINKNNLLIDLLIHPIVYAKYDKKGHLLDISTKEKKDYVRQSHIHIHIKETVSDKVLNDLETGLYEAMEDVYYANRDWRKMLAELKNAREELASAKTKTPAKEIQSYCDFLDYLHNNNFTLLGYREYEFVDGKKGALASKTVRGSSLGLLHNDVKPAYITENREGLPRNLQEMRRNLSAVSVSKTNRLATVHRRVPMDAIAIKTYDKSGRPKGEKLFLGLFTSVTYSRSVSDVPLLREKVERVMKRTDFLPNSHDHKAIRHILEKYPRDELFQIPEDELYPICLNILRLQERQRIALFVRRDPFKRYISCLVYIPRDRFATLLRKHIGEILERELAGTISSFTTSLDDSLFARVMFVINVDQNNAPKFDAQHLETLLQDAGQTWAERLASALAHSDSHVSDITELTLKYGEAFPISYTENYTAKKAVFDIDKIENALTLNTLELDLYKPHDIGDNKLRLKVYSPDEPLVLSDVMPILEHMGLRAIAELPFEIKPENSNTVWIHDFLLEAPTNGHGIDIADVKENFEELFTKIWYGSVESDSLNRLVLSANMDWRETTILRTYVRYLKQIGYRFGRLYVEKALTQNPKMSRLLVDLFIALFDPAQDCDVAAIKKSISRGLQKVDSLDQDRTLRSILSLIKASLRTNFYQRDENGHHKPCLSIKFDSKKIDELPQPKPYREIFVYSPRVEGIHLRGDKIARGGLRWSDRQEDFRTEVLGLMKAQQVKNSVIVPMGAKGGFVVKTPTHSRDEFMSEGIECYKIFVRGLLDITDNRKGTKIVPPDNVVRRDEDDPYLVVAADKGTASFSDIANGLSKEYDFWLDDAFASGGSAGYDHKKMGITAKGAWESVKLHFRQLNHNTQEQPFDVVGVGDMGGDVFGNGMLLSEHIRLVGAFNHLHIFCDPDPDTAKSFKERKRLFDGVKGWDAYDESKLSKGGKIYSRAEKTLKLTPEIQHRFDLESSSVSPLELMNAMLKARTDLLWFGGIGTYIKASSESHADVGDKANDQIRINGKDVRAKVIGEGANLGVTQLGRIEFEGNGGKINTDFVDNSGGVDSSDHEVNIKIVLTEIMKDKNTSMTLVSRNKLLESMTDEVAEHVLRHNYEQALAISLAEFQAPENLEEHEQFIQYLEREKGLNRVIEGLPTAGDIDFRIRTGKGLTRPELAILVSYAKISFTQDLLASDAPDNEDMQKWLIEYFPTAMQKKFKPQLLKHRLGREIIATMLASDMINHMGPTFPQLCAEKTGAGVSEVAKAYMIVRGIFKFEDLWADIEALDNKVPAMVQLRALKEISKLADHAMTWFLTHGIDTLDIQKDSTRYEKGIQNLQKDLNTLIAGDLKTNIETHIQSAMDEGLPKALATKIAILPAMTSACDIISVAATQDVDLKATAATYFEVGQVFKINWLRNKARYLSGDDYWQNEAAQGLIDQLYSCQSGLTARILRDSAVKKAKGQKSTGKSFVKGWLEKHGHMKEQIDPLLSEIKQAGTVDLPMLVLAEQRLRNLYGG
ncbi:MAG: NAD-glutamate dehydrogenase [Alphaproteobacteria bacterium]|nr:NAD-glutamate dehydrogenase [Alphaproteobacteria bacterium]